MMVVTSRRLLLLWLLKCSMRSRQGRGGSAQHCSGSRDKCLDVLLCGCCGCSLNVVGACLSAICNFHVACLIQQFCVRNACVQDPNAYYALCHGIFRYSIDPLLGGLLNTAS